MVKYRLEVEVQEKGWPSNGIARLRRWLKSGLRGYGVVCKGIVEDGNDRSVSDEAKPVDIDNRVP